MSRELLNVNETSTIKAGDDSTTLILSAHDDNEPRIFKAGDIATIHIDTDDAHVADVPAKLIVGSNNINVNSADLAKLAPGDYQLELWVSQKDGPATTIYPSDGFLDLKIDRNADNLEGGKITTITLDQFKKQLNDAINEAEKKAVPGKDGKDGAQGPQGEPGPAGKDGKPGQPGKSAYELAVDQGFSGTESQWLESLKKGPAGPQGQPGQDGKNGIDGKSAYELAVDQGFSGTESQWLKSLVGPEGPQGKQGLPGKDGHDGEQGPAGQPGQPGKDGQNGKDGLTPTFKFGPVVTLPSGSEAKADLTKNDDGSYTINLSIPAGPKGETGGINQVVKPDLSIGTIQTVASDQNASASLTKTGETGYAINLSIPAGPAGKSGVDGKPGKDGSDGKPGADGKSAYELAVAQGFKGDLDTWLESLRGPQGKQGEQGPAGKDGSDGQPGHDGKQGPAGQPGKDGKDGARGPVIWQSSETVNGRGGSYEFAISQLTSQVANVTPQAGDVIIAQTSGNADVAFIISSQDGTTAKIDANVIRLTGQSGADGQNGHSVWVYNGNSSAISTSVSTLSNYTSTSSLQPVVGDLVVGNDGTISQITYVGQSGMGTESAYITTGSVLATIKAQSNTATPKASTFDYSKYPNLPIISQENLGHYLGLDSTKNYTLNVDDNTLSDGTNTTQKALKPGIYLLRDYQGNGYNLTIKSDQAYGLAYGTLVQLIVTPYMVFAAVVGPYQAETLCARMQWDHDFSDYYGVSNKWFVVGQETKTTN